ncbi:MAG: porin family protein [Flavobacteriaceae bacterium]
MFSTIYGQDQNIENLKTDDKKRLRFGYYLGLNSVGAKITYLASALPTNPNEVPFRLVVKPKPSFDVGLLADVRINEFLNVRFHPGVAFVEREIRFQFSKTTTTYKPLIVKSNYVRFPLGIKLNTRRIRNARPFVMGSISNNINITSEESNPNDNTSRTFRMKRNMFAWEFAIGADIYLPYFKFTPSIHGVFALNNELVADNSPTSDYTKSIESMKSRGVFLRFTFE